MVAEMGSHYCAEFIGKKTGNRDFYIKDPEYGKLLVGICSNIADYVHKKGIDNILLPDRGARAAYIGIRGAWEKKYSDDTPPQIFFVNPRGFSKPGSQEEFETNYISLVSQKEKPLLVFDTCIHNGETMRSILESLKKSGFKDVKVGVVSEELNFSEIKPDFTAFMTFDGLKNCRPFGGNYAIEDGMMDKSNSSVIPESTENLNDRGEAIKLRKKIKKIFREAPDEWFTKNSWRSLSNVV